MNKIVVVTLAMVLVASMAFAGVASNGFLLAKKSHESSSSSDSGSGSSDHSSDSHSSDSKSSDSGSGDNGDSSNSNGDSGSGDSGSTSHKASTSDIPSADSSTSDIPSTDSSTSDLPVSHGPHTESSVSDIPPTDNIPIVKSEPVNVGNPVLPNEHLIPPNESPIKPTNPGSNPVLPQEPVKPIDKTPIDFNCHFHPDKCVPDVQGQCPSGFVSNDHGGCHPTGPCPNGFERHTDDESGKCFKGPNFCHFHNCGSDGNSGHTVVKVIHKTKVVHKKDLVGIPTVFVPKIGLVEPFNCKLNEDNGKIGCEFIIIKVIT